MAIKNILVAYNGTESSSSALRLALLMAKKYGAKLTGALTYGPSEVAASLQPFTTVDISTVITEHEIDRRKEIKEGFFAELATESGIRSDWIEASGDTDYSLMELARVFDIVAMGQYEATRENRNLVPHPDMIARHSGRPILVVPKEWDDAVLSERAVLAWDGGRAAARAMSDALAILETKDHVSVVTVGHGTGDIYASLERVGRHLACHGIETELDIVAKSGRSTADALLETAELHKAGLLVMGAYEHSKLAEALWGGVTNSVLSRAKVPVLMSH